jgi:hypothetical protein
MSIFTEAPIEHEHSQWKAVVTASVAIDSSTLCANFESLEEAEHAETETNFDTTIDVLDLSLAGDILQQFHNEIALEEKLAVRIAADGKSPSQ